MLELHKRSPRTPQEQEVVKWEIEPSADAMIERLLYALFLEGVSISSMNYIELHDFNVRFFL